MDFCLSFWVFTSIKVATINAGSHLRWDAVPWDPPRGYDALVWTFPEGLVAPQALVGPAGGAGWCLGWTPAPGQCPSSRAPEVGAAKPRELLSSLQTLPQHTKALGQDFYLQTGKKPPGFGVGKKPPGFGGGDAVQLYCLNFLLTVYQICWTRSKGIKTASI